MKYSGSKLLPVRATGKNRQALDEAYLEYLTANPDLKGQRYGFNQHELSILNQIVKHPACRKRFVAGQWKTLDALYAEIIRPRKTNKLPAATATAQPSKSRKFAELMILAAALGLEVAVTLHSAEEAQLETLIRTAAKTLSEPSNHYAREVALRNGITFEGKLLDCFGLWERDNFYCLRCQIQADCLAVVKEASLGALTAPAMREFRVPADFDRETIPLRTVSVDKSNTDANVAALTDRKMLLSWIEAEFPSLVRVDFTESTNFQIAHPYRKRLVVLKVERFSPRAYTTLFHAATPEQAEALNLSKTRHGYLFSLPDVLLLQDAIRSYLRTVLDLPAMSIVLSREEEVKQRIQKRLVEEWTGRIEPRTGYELFLDTRNLRILRFNRFSAKGFMLDFSRWNEKIAAEHGLRHTGSGARYEGTDEAELNALLNQYLHSIRSKYFSPRHPLPQMLA